MTKGLQVSIDGEFIGVYVPGEGEWFSVALDNEFETYMSGRVHSGSKSESWSWELPDVREGQVISFRLVETDEKGVPPDFIEPAKRSSKG